MYGGVEGESEGGDNEREGIEWIEGERGRDRREREQTEWIEGGEVGGRRERKEFKYGERGSKGLGSVVILTSFALLTTIIRTTGAHQ